MASPAVSVNPILSLEDSGNQKPHPSERIIQSELGVTGKAWISSFAPLRRCPSGGIQLFVGGSMIPLLPVEPERIARGYQSKGTLDLLDLGVGKNVASFLSWISNSKNVTLGHPMPPLQSPEDPQSQTFLFAETKPEILRQQRAPDSKYFASGIVLLKSPSGLLSLVPLWECQGLSRVRELAYFPEPEAMGKEYASDFGENPSSAIVTMVQPSQDPKIQTPLLDKSQEDKGRGQLGVKITMAPLVRDKVAQILEEKYGTSNELPEHLTFTRSAKLATAASIIRQTTTQEKLQDHQQTLPPQKSGFSQGPGKTTTGNPELRLPQTPQPNQTEQGRGWTQNQEGQASEESSENINTQGPGLGSVPPTGWLNPVFLVKLGTQRKISELEATSGHSWLCLEGGCWEVILQALDSFQDLKTTDVKSLLSRILSSRSKSLQMEAAGTVPSKDVQITEVSLGSLQLSPQRESFHSDWTTQSLISGPHFVDNFSLRPALPGNWTDPWSFDWFCDFEADLCGWQQNGTGAAWVLTQDQNSPSWRGSPSLESACHFPGGNHLSLQNQDSPQTVPKAVLISPILHGARWIRFWYGPLQPGMGRYQIQSGGLGCKDMRAHITEPLMGTISVYVYSRAQFEWHLIWSSVAHQSSSWTWVEMKLWPSRKIQGAHLDALEDLESCPLAGAGHLEGALASAGSWAFRRQQGALSNRPSKRGGLGLSLRSTRRCLA
ncbi:uncharacterized protein LOC141517806 [Macrotis lagotis]|uniref:uncharacterized protein LOC141517806 n=1 Tax=Macrotis lagotis TaxID=92651 RepID=UPI003D699693